MSSTGHSSPHSRPTGPSFTIGTLPPLPDIQSERIRKRIFTHSSLSDHRHDFQAPGSDPSSDNEELGHIGDQVFGLALTNLIQDCYPLLRVGPASKVRDYVKRKPVLAEICVLYGLHKRLNIPERQASLRSMQNVKVNVFKAYVGGVYKDQGFEVVSNWLSLLTQCQVEAAYQTVRKEYLLPPTTTAVTLPSPPTSSGDTRPDASSHLARDRGAPSQHISHAQADAHRQGSGKAGGADGDGDGASAPDMAKQPSRKRRRRRSNPKEGDTRVAAPDSRRAEGAPPPRRSSMGSDMTGDVRKRARSGDAGGL